MHACTYIHTDGRTMRKHNEIYWIYWYHLLDDMKISRLTTDTVCYFMLLFCQFNSILSFIMCTWSAESESVNNNAEAISINISANNITTTKCWLTSSRVNRIRSSVPFHRRQPRHSHSQTGHTNKTCGAFYKYTEIKLQLHTSQKLTVCLKLHTHMHTHTHTPV